MLIFNLQDKVFQRYLPSYLDALSKNCEVIIKEFHSDVLSGVQQSGRDSVGLNILDQQHRTHVASLLDMPKTLKDVVIRKQRDANRGFKPVIQKGMVPAYRTCAAEGGEFRILR